MRARRKSKLIKISNSKLGGKNLVTSEVIGGEIVVRGVVEGISGVEEMPVRFRFVLVAVIENAVRGSAGVVVVRRGREVKDRAGLVGVDIVERREEVKKNFKLVFSENLLIRNNGK